MKTPTPFAKEIAAFPAPLRRLIEAELEAGNQIVELSSTFPAPPAGAYVKLANPVSTRPRKTARSVTFYDRNSSGYSGEFTTAERFYFVLEPPHPPEPPPDMDAVRAALEAKQRASDAALYTAQRAGDRKKPKRKVATEPPPSPSVVAPQPKNAVDRFRESMVGNYERWHDGIGYDIGILKTASPEELVEIENLLVSRGVSDWRDVEALAALDSPRARLLLVQTAKTGSKELAVAVADHAPGLVSETDRTATLVSALESCDFYAGLTETLGQVEEFHPPEIVAALFRGLLNRPGAHAVHFAAMLMFIHGKAETSFDWNQRPFFLRFHTDDRAAHEQAFRELCDQIGVQPDAYL